MLSLTLHELEKTEGKVEGEIINKVTPRPPLLPFFPNNKDEEFTGEQKQKAPSRGAQDP